MTTQSGFETLSQTVQGWGYANVDVFAKEQAKSFEAGADEAIESLRRQLKKHKEKNLTAH